MKKLSVLPRLFFVCFSPTGVANAINTRKRYIFGFVFLLLLMLSGFSGDLYGQNPDGHSHFGYGAQY